VQVNTPSCEAEAGAGGLIDLLHTLLFKIDGAVVLGIVLVLWLKGADLIRKGRGSR
jgi:hypothetical protein